MEGSRLVGKKQVKASSNNERFLGDSLPKGEWEEKKLREMEIGMNTRHQCLSRQIEELGFCQGDGGKPSKGSYVFRFTFV